MKPLYFGISDALTPGEFYHVDANDWNPEYIVFHPDDFEAIQSAYAKAGRELIHIKYESTEEWANRILNRIRLV